MTQLQELFIERFDAWPTGRVISPGRVNLIGEHTDYNDGFVSPMAIERHIEMAFRPRDDGQAVLYTGDDPNPVRFDVASVDKLRGWGVFPQGVVRHFANDGLDIRGFEAVFSSSIPSGSGLSSSAALELAVARTLTAVTNGEWNATDMALRCVRAENEWVGVACGVMDQLICATAVDGAVSRIDCVDYSTYPVQLPSGVVVLILHSGTKRGLVDSEYNERRATCERASSELGVKSLRYATMEMLSDSDLDDLARRRARHVITENQRVLDWGQAVALGDWSEAGRLMVASHESLRDDFEVSGPALDVMVDVALDVDGVYGARLTGAGFAGACVAIVATDKADAAAATIDREFRKRYDAVPQIIPSLPVRGTSLSLTST